MKSEDPSKLIYSLEELLIWRDALAREGKSVVLTNGCFDLLHRGHISYLHESAALGDRLIVAINSDQSVRELKGQGRPLNSEWDRAYAMASLRCVDAVFIFQGPRLDMEILTLKPDLYTKAGDYTIDTLDSSERTALESARTQIHIMPFVKGHSTTNLVERATQR
jgi:rfaE bifunctional protein nucleotidyltransferase chain/domain